MIYLKTLCLLIISLFLISCTGGCDNTASIGHYARPLDNLKSFSIDFTNTDNIVIDVGTVSTITKKNTLGLCEDSTTELTFNQQTVTPTFNNIDITSNVGNFSASSSIMLHTEQGADSIGLTDNFSLHFWINPTSAGRIISSFEFNVVINADNDLVVSVGDNELTKPIALNTWQFVSIVNSSNNSLNFSLSIDNTQRTRFTSELYYPFPFEINLIGGYNQSFQGSLDKINFINEILTETAISEIYETTKGEYEALNNALGVTSLMQQSQLVAQGRIAAVDYVLQEDNPITVLTIEVANLYKGQLPVESQENHQIKVAFSGGLNTENGDIVKQGHCPDLFYERQNYLFFIADNGKSHCPFVKNNQGVYQIFNVDNQDYVFNLDGFPVTQFSKNTIQTGVRQNTKFLQNITTNIEALKQDNKAYTTTLADNTEVQFCNCLTPFYDYEELAQTLLSKQQISPQSSFAQMVAKVMPSEEAKGVMLATIQLAIKKQKTNQQSKQLTTAFYKMDITTNNKFKNFNGQLSLQLNEQPQLFKINN